MGYGPDEGKTTLTEDVRFPLLRRVCMYVYVHEIYPPFQDVLMRLLDGSKKLFEQHLYREHLICVQQRLKRKDLGVIGRQSS